MSHYEDLRGVSVPRKAWVRHALSLWSLPGFIVHAFLWFAVVTTIFVLAVLAFSIKSGHQRTSPVVVNIVLVLYFGLLAGYLIRGVLRFVQARRVIREGKFVLAVVESAQEFHGDHGTSGTALALRLPEHVGGGRISVVFDSYSIAADEWRGDDIPVLVLPGSKYCAAFPGKAQLCPAGEAQSLLIRGTHGRSVLRAAIRGE
jgi:hypothetical protein